MKKLLLLTFYFLVGCAASVEGVDSGISCVNDTIYIHRISENSFEINSSVFIANGTINSQYHLFPFQNGIGFNDYELTFTFQDQCENSKRFHYILSSLRFLNTGLYAVKACDVDNNCLTSNEER